MATYGKQMTLTYVAWDTSNNVGKTGDVSNHTLRWVKDGTSSAPTNSATEVDATNVPGLYKVTLTTTETQTPIGTLHGKSSTANISIMPITVHFERTPDAAPGDSGGLPRVSDVLSAFEDTGLVLETTTISGAPTSQTQFNIAAGSADDDAYNYCIIVFEDAATATQRAVGLIKDYTGATKEVFLADAPAFTIADTDNVRILSTNALEIAKGVWDRLLTASTHNIANSAGRRLRALQESGSAYGGYIWIDTVNGTAGTTAYENGTSDNPVDNITDANSLASTLGLSRFKVAPGSDINFAATQQNQLFDGERWTLSLGSQTITNTVIIGATIDGTGNGTGVRFVDCHFLAGASIPPGTYTMCGFAGTSGTAVTSSGTGGQWYLIRCYSDVAGAGTPYFNWSGVSAATGINVRAWNGGNDWTIDSNCDLSLEVEQGGGQTITTGGGDVEVRGIFRALTLVLSAAETAQFVGVTGPINLSGTTTATVNLYGVAEDLTDTTSAAVVTNRTVSRDNINLEVSDVLKTDTVTLPGQTAPPGTPTLEQALAYLYKAWRNKSDQSATTYQLYDDVGSTVDQTATVSSAGGTVTRGEVAAGT